MDEKTVVGMFSEALEKAAQQEGNKILEKLKEEFSGKMIAIVNELALTLRNQVRAIQRLDRDGITFEIHIPNTKDLK